MYDISVILSLSMFKNQYKNSYCLVSIFTIKLNLIFLIIQILNFIKVILMYRTQLFLVCL